MSRQEEVILTNMCMIYDNKGNVLVQDRVDKNYCGISVKLAGGMDKMLRLFEEENLSEYFFYKENGKWEKKLL